MPISTLPPAPQRQDEPTLITKKADAMFSALPAFVTEANALEANVNAKEVSANAAAASASISATNAASSATSAANSATTATTRATNASNSATAADTSATNAANSATTASNAATTATNQANTATTQATNAATSATLASDWAQKTTGTVNGSGYSAKYWAEQAAGSVAAGVIDDSVTSTLKTWSSSKINTVKQNTLVSGTNIKTINGESVLGVGDIDTKTSVINNQSYFLSQV